MNGKHTLTNLTYLLDGPGRTRSVSECGPRQSRKYYVVGSVCPGDPDKTNEHSTAVNVTTTGRFDKDVGGEKDYVLFQLHKQDLPYVRVSSVVQGGSTYVGSD